MRRKPSPQSGKASEINNAIERFRSQLIQLTTQHLGLIDITLEYLSTNVLGRQDRIRRALQEIIETSRLRDIPSRLSEGKEFEEILARFTSVIERITISSTTGRSRLSNETLANLQEIIRNYRTSIRTGKKFTTSITNLNDINLSIKLFNNIVKYLRTVNSAEQNLTLQNVYRTIIERYERLIEDLTNIIGYAIFEVQIRAESNNVSVIPNAIIRSTLNLTYEGVYEYFNKLLRDLEYKIETNEQKLITLRKVYKKEDIIKSIATLFINRNTEEIKRVLVIAGTVGYNLAEIINTAISLLTSFKVLKIPNKLKTMFKHARNILGAFSKNNNLLYKSDNKNINDNVVKLGDKIIESTEEIQRLVRMRDILLKALNLKQQPIRTITTEPQKLIEQPGTTKLPTMATLPTTTTTTTTLKEEELPLEPTTEPILPTTTTTETLLPEPTTEPITPLDISEIPTMEQLQKQGLSKGLEALGASIPQLPTTRQPIGLYETEGISGGLPHILSAAQQITEQEQDIEKRLEEQREIEPKIKREQIQIPPSRPIQKLESTTLPTQSSGGWEEIYPSTSQIQASIQASTQVPRQGTIPSPIQESILAPTTTPTPSSRGRFNWENIDLLFFPEPQARPMFNMFNVNIPLVRYNNIIDGIRFYQTYAIENFATMREFLLNAYDTLRNETIDLLVLIVEYGDEQLENLIGEGQLENLIEDIRNNDVLVVLELLVLLTSASVLPSVCNLLISGIVDMFLGSSKIPAKLIEGEILATQLTKGEEQSVPISTPSTTITPLGSEQNQQIRTRADETYPKPIFTSDEKIYMETAKKNEEDTRFIKNNSLDYKTNYRYRRRKLK